MKVKYQEYIIRNDGLPDYIRKKREKCFVCGKQHCVIGGVQLTRMININYKKVQYIVSTHAPLGCWLAHNKKYIKEFYKEKNYYGWKRNINRLRQTK
jgi:hypothetical protein